MSTPNTEILVLDIIFQQEKPGFLGEMTNSRSGSENIQDVPGVSCNGRM